MRHDVETQEFTRWCLHKVNPTILAMTTNGEPNWRELYRAVMQADRDELPGLIEDTSAAIVHRLKEIGYRSNLPERYQLVEALDAMRAATRAGAQGGAGGPLRSHFWLRLLIFNTMFVAARSGQRARSF